jgi:outer membrane lipoprotein-sorting protein
MKRWFPIGVVAALAALSAVCAGGVVRAAGAPPADVISCPAGADHPDPAVLIKRFEQLLRGQSMIATMTMTVKTPSWTRKLKFKVWSKGKDYALVRILEGAASETGMMTLKREKQLWTWLPQAGRLMKLPSSMMGDSWMGSDFTNDDLVNGSSLTDDFDSSFVGVVTQDGREAWKVSLKPKPNAVVVWGRIEALIDRQNCEPLAEFYYDEDNKLVRRMLFANYRQFGWRMMPMKMSVVPAEPGHETAIDYEDVQFDVAVPENTFSLERLRQGR